MAITVLATDLAELAGTIGENTGKAGVRQTGVGGAAAAIEAAAEGPAAVDAVFGIGIEAESVLGLENIKRRQLVAGAPEQFCAEEERMVDGAAERLPTKSGIRAVEIREEKGRIESCANGGIVVTAGVGGPEIEVGRFAEVAVDAKVADNADVLAAIGGEKVTGIAAVNRGRSLEEPVFRGRQETGKGNTGIVGAVFAADEGVGREGP